jgi:hypothetical protein
VHHVGFITRISTGVYIVQSHMHTYEYVWEFVSVCLSVSLYLFRMPELFHFYHERPLQHILERSLVKNGYTEQL